jgi:hypothetical protein
MINVWESLDAAAEAGRFCDIYELKSPVLLDERSELIERVMVRGVPFNLVIDETGMVLGAGLTHPEELVAFLEATGMLEPVR